MLRQRIAIYVNFEFDSFRYVDHTGYGEYVIMKDLKPKWTKSLVHKRFLSKRCGDIFLGYL